MDYRPTYRPEYIPRTYAAAGPNIEFIYNYMINYRNYHCVQRNSLTLEIIAAWKITKLKYVTNEMQNIFGNKPGKP